ncbi:helix-turn-helix domain-containing protein [Rhodohalobacter halophilus]|uniref:MarR family transcriptional regulator n=1 Tax=Rhodohalobacter halophilus TaxID=1812810 RepID=UPI00083F9639|nr:MarR family transcriptional regulator [Rhodohalobacter halophilus]
MKNSENQLSALRYPLTAILGSKGHVIVLRVLIRSKHPLSHSELLERTDLSRQGVYDITKRLVETGVVTYTGYGRQQLVTVREDYPLYRELVSLFNMETQRYKELVDTLRSGLSNLERQPESAWIFGSAARGEDEYGDPVQIALLGKLKTIDSLTGEFREKLIQYKVESTFDVTIDIRGVTIADLETKPYLTEEGTVHLWGIDPKDYLNPQTNKSTSVTSHKDLDERSMVESKIWTELLKSNPEIIPRTISLLDKQIDKTSTGEKLELLEWKNLLENSSNQRLKKFMESDSERAIRLRQSLPFWQVLTESEKNKFEHLKEVLKQS